MGSEMCIRDRPQLIKQIIKDMGFKNNTKGCETPALVTIILNKDEDDDPMDEEWEYRSIVGKLNYLEKTSRPDIAYAVHQCARFSSNPKVSHAAALKRIVRYLLTTSDKRMLIKPTDQSFQCWVDSDYCGLWNKPTAEANPNTAKSRTGYVITYAGTPLVWASRMQGEIALSTTEAEYIALSESLCSVILLTQLINEIRERGFPIPAPAPATHCKAFGDNSGALEIARTPKMRPRTRHLNVKYHHFRDAVARGLSSLVQVGTLNQVADIFTKPLGKELFVKQ